MQVLKKVLSPLHALVFLGKVGLNTCEMAGFVIELSYQLLTDLLV